MEFSFEKLLPYPCMALIVLAAFYGIYFAKMLIQKRRGIQTRQIAAPLCFFFCPSSPNAAALFVP